VTWGRFHFWLTLFVVAWMLGADHAPWWHIGVFIGLLWLVRLTALYEFCDGVP
jgi:hypothetical protein